MSMLHIATYEGRVGGEGGGSEVESASLWGTFSHPLRPRGLASPTLPYSFLSLFLSLLFYFRSCLVRVGVYRSVKHLLRGGEGS